MLVIGVTVFQDANHAGDGDDVGAGLAGLAFLLGLGVFLLSSGLGILLGYVASRRAPDWRLADVAFGLKVITLFGVVIGFPLIGFL